MSDPEQTPISNRTSDAEDDRVITENVKEAKNESINDKEEGELQPAKIVRSTIVRPDVNAVADESPKQRRSHSPPSIPTGPRYALSRRSPPSDPNRPRVIDVDPIRRRERERQLAIQAHQPQDKLKKEVDPVAEQKKLQLTTRTGGAYIPPHRLRQMQQDITDKSSPEFQRITWEALKKSINGLINKVNTSNIKEIVVELFGENLIRGRGLFARSIMKAQAASLSFTSVYASVLSVVNSKLPQVGELLLTRLIIQFRRAFKRNDKTVCLATTTFIAHLTNQYVAHEIIALQMLALLLERPTDDSVEIAVGFMKEVGAHLAEVSPKANNAAYERFRSILHEGQIDKRVQYMVEVLFQVRKDKYKENLAINKDLDLVEEEDQITHYLGLDDEGLETQEGLNVFKMDPSYLENEAKYTELKKEIVNASSEDENGENSGDEGSEEGSEDEAALEDKMQINDQTNADLISLRRNIYLTIMSALDFEECVHKLMKLQIQPGQEMELCNMIIDCCSQERTYEKYYGLIGERLSKLNRTWSENFEQGFVNTYQTIHRYETNRLRNVSKYFGHLLFTDAISWEVLSVVHLNEEETTSASRIFVKIMLQELSEHMGLKKLRERLVDPYMKEAFQGMFPRDNPKHTRFAINYFTSVGLGGLTDELREWLKNAPKMIMSQSREESDSDEDSDSESDDSDSDNTSDSEGSSSESESKSESSKDDRRRRRLNSKDRYPSNRGKTSASRRKASPSPPPEGRSSRRGRSPSRSRSLNSRSRSLSPSRSLSRSSRPRYSRSRTPSPRNRRSSKTDRRTRHERSISRTRSRSPHSPRKRRHSLSLSPPPRRVRGRDRSPLSPVSPNYRRQRSYTPEDNHRDRYRSRSRESIKRKARDDSRDAGRGLKRRGRDVKWDEKDRDRSRGRR